ncbi:hypothetical protein Hsar01_03722 [Haloferula sargassicola]|uniref:Uncharacterized protein n=2 Tax=Haloferula sargassicola TaxID=490096 RepID=A0ABP9USG3_9BACT
MSYLRFTPLGIRGTGNLMQISELLLYDASGNPIPTENSEVVSATGDSPAAEVPANAFDGVTTNKWLDPTFSDAELIIKFLDPEGTSGETREVTVGSYNYVTGNDATGRDPVSWTIEKSDDGFTWEPIDVVYGFVPDTGRNVEATATPREFPTAFPPVLDTLWFDNPDFISPLAVVPNGSVDFFVDAMFATDLSFMVEGGATVPAVDEDVTSVPFPDDSDSKVTLTLSRDGASIQAPPMTVRTVTPVTRTVNQVRFTPVKRRSSGDIQLSEFQFFDSYGDLANPVTPTDVLDDNGTNAPDAGEGALKLIDGDITTKWYSGNSAPITFVFPEGTTIGAYSFATANDFDGRDPIQWVLEGSSDGGLTWDYIDSMLGLSYPTPTARNTFTQEFPLPADGTMTPWITWFTIDFSSVATVTPGGVAELDWTVENADTVTILPEPGEVANHDDFAEVTVNEETTYTLTASAATGNRKATAAVKAFLPLPYDGTLDYPNFDNGGGIIVNGTAEILNAFGNFPNDPDAARLRITGLANGQNNSAFYYEPVDLSGGFSTSFTAEITASGLNGADDLVFLVQNTTQGEFYVPNGQTPDPTTSGPSMAVVIDTYKNDGDLGFSTVKVIVNGELIQQVDLSEFTDDINMYYYAGTPGEFYSDAYFLHDPVGGGTGYDLQIDYYPGALTVTMEGATILDRVPVDLGATGSAVLDSEGKAYVGFTGRTGGLSQNGDILNWYFTTEGIVPPANGLALTGYTFDMAATPATLTLTWDSTTGMFYDVTSSTTLGDWSPVMEDIEATGSSTSVTIDLPGGPAGFFRVEEVPAP